MPSPLIWTEESVPARRPSCDCELIVLVVENCVVPERPVPPSSIVSPKLKPIVWAVPVKLKLLVVVVAVLNAPLA